MDLEEGLRLAVLLVGILLQGHRELHAHEGLDEVEELARLGEVELGSVRHLHTRSDDELIETPVNGVFVQQVILDAAVLVIDERDERLLEPLRGEIAFHVCDGDRVIAFVCEAFRTVAGLEVHFELTHVFFFGFWFLVLVAPFTGE